jgi:hypothetical protein
LVSILVVLVHVSEACPCKEEVKLLVIPLLF